MTIDEAVRAAFKTFLGRYGSRKWDIPAEAANGWAASFESDGCTAQEILAAAKAWSDVNNWPPCYAELRGVIPKFCRCKKCHACHRRALKRACDAINRGQGGVEDFSPPQLSELVADALPNGGMPRLEPPRPPPQLPPTAPRASPMRALPPRRESSTVTPKELAAWRAADEKARAAIERLQPERARAYRSAESA